MKGPFFAAFIGAFLLFGCVREERPVTTQFTSAEHEPYLKEGTAVVTGQAFLRQQGGAVVRCSGEPVLIFPATPFFNEVFSIWRAGQRPKLDFSLDPRMQKIARKGTCDADGKFKFEKLPNGKWYVMTQVRWMAGSNPQGGELVGEVTTQQKSTSDVILSDSNKL
jgi:hypothetical protein